jgi:hypothetical protein
VIALALVVIEEETFRDDYFLRDKKGFWGAISTNYFLVSPPSRYKQQSNFSYFILYNQNLLI